MEHKDIPDNQLHEVKGAASAPNGTYLKAKGDGTTEFSRIDISDVTGISKLQSQASLDDQAELSVVIAEFNKLISGMKVHGLMSV